MASPSNSPQGYFPQQPDTRQRSPSYTDRYRPHSYSNPPPHQPDQHLLGPHQHPLPPAGTMVRQEPPYPVDQAPHMNMPIVPQRQLAQDLPPRRPSAEMYQGPVMYPDGLRRPSYGGSGVEHRRPSHESRRSHHSDRSHRSHRSNRSPSYRNDRRDDDADDYEQEREHHHHHHHHHHDAADDLAAFRQRKKDRGENVSRSWGDSLLDVFSPLKYLFEPRDKY